MEHQDYGRFLRVIKKSIRAHHLEAMRAVNWELVALYWEFGKAIQRKQEELEREFYLRATARNGWTRDVLKHQLDNKTYEKYLLSQSSFDQVLPQQQRAHAILAVKDHYNFEFLELAEEHSERE